MAPALVQMSWWHLYTDSSRYQVSLGRQRLVSRVTAKAEAMSKCARRRSMMLQGPACMVLCNVYAKHSGGIYSAQLMLLCWFMLIMQALNSHIPVLKVNFQLCVFILQPCYLRFEIRDHVVTLGWLCFRWGTLGLLQSCRVCSLGKLQPEVFDVLVSLLQFLEQTSDGESPCRAGRYAQEQTVYRPRNQSSKSRSRRPHPHRHWHVAAPGLVGCRLVQRRRRYGAISWFCWVSGPTLCWLSTTKKGFYCHQMLCEGCGLGDDLVLTWRIDVWRGVLFKLHTLVTSGPKVIIDSCPQL